MSQNKKIDCLSIESWNPKQTMFSQPKKSKLGKDINVISTQINSKLTLQSPLMKTWGISDFVDPDTGVSSGRFNMSLNFPNEGYTTQETDMFKSKLQELQNNILEEAYKNRLAWFGDDEMSLDVIKSKMYNILKYPKIKDDKGQLTKKSDYSKAPTLSLKVSNYDNVWRCEVYDMNKNRLFPSDNKDQAPYDFVTKGSEVIAKIQCGGIWTGDKAWGVKWNMVLCFVKPSEQYNPFSIASIELPVLGEKSQSTAPIEEVSKPEPEIKKVPQADTYVEDSDNEEDPVVKTTDVKDVKQEEEEALQPTPVVKEDETSPTTPVVKEEESVQKVVKKKVVVKKTVK